jgi:hypothetical protein
MRKDHYRVYSEPRIGALFEAHWRPWWWPLWWWPLSDFPTSRERCEQLCIAHARARSCGHHPDTFDPYSRILQEDLEESEALLRRAQRQPLPPPREP